MNRLAKCYAGMLVFTVSLLTAFKSASADSEPGPFSMGHHAAAPIIFLYGLIVLVLAGISMAILYRIHGNKNKNGN